MSLIGDNDRKAKLLISALLDRAWELGKEGYTYEKYKEWKDKMRLEE